MPAASRTWGTWLEGAAANHKFACWFNLSCQVTRAQRDLLDFSDICFSHSEEFIRFYNDLKQSQAVISAISNHKALGGISVLVFNAEQPVSNWSIIDLIYWIIPSDYFLSNPLLITGSPPCHKQIGLVSKAHIANCLMAGSITPVAFSWVSHRIHCGPHESIVQVLKITTTGWKKHS